MNTEHDFDRLLTAWLAADAPTREPESLLGTVLDRTARTKRRPAWRVPERWIPMSAISTRLASSTRVPLRTVGAVALLILALVVGAALLIGSQRRALPAPFGPAANGQIMYVKAGDLVARDTLTGAETTIIGGPSDDGGPWFSNDGSKFTFFRGTSDTSAELWIADQGGLSPHRLGGPYQDPSWIDWSPDGRTLVLQSLVAGTPMVRLIAVDGSGSTTLDVGMPAMVPSFRPSDGHQLMFRGEDAGGVIGLYLVGLDGKGATRLALGDETQVVDAAYFDDPAWSPDGKRLAYVSYSTMSGSAEGMGVRVHVADIGPDGTVTGQTTLPDDPAISAEFSPTWLPTSDGFVYKRVHGGDLPTLAIARFAAGSAASAVSRDLGVSGDPIEAVTVSPDGSQALSRVGKDNVAWLSDLSAATSTLAGVANDDVFSWQRVAR